MQKAKLMPPCPEPHFKSLAELSENTRGKLRDEVYEIAKTEFSLSRAKLDWILKAYKVSKAEKVDPDASDYHWELKVLLFAMEGGPIPPIANERSRRLIEEFVSELSRTGG